MKRFIKKFTAAVLSAVMFMGTVSTYTAFETAIVYADDLTLAAESLAEGTNVAVTNGKNVEIRFASAQYTTFADVLNAGYKTLNINYNVTSYTALSGETPGIMPFVTYGKTWSNGGAWKNLSDGTSGTLSLDLTQFASSTEAVKFGIQIANISGTVSYSVSASLSGSGSGGNTGGDTSGKLVNTIDMSNNDIEMNYAKLLQESLYFYDANMCGTDVDENSEFSWRKDCHVSDEKVTWNGRTVDVSGGYHDAGDHVKFGLPAAYSASMLGLAYYEYKDVFDELGQSAHYKRIADRFADYFERCTVLDDSSSVLTFCYQVGNGDTDHGFQGKPEDQESVQGSRPAYFTSDLSPCTDVVSETAAALAIYSINFNDKKALEYAEALFAYAKNHEKKSGGDGMWNFYNSGSCEDDYALAAAMLYRATKNESYKTEYYSNASAYECGWPACWDNVKTLANLYSPSGKPQGSGLPAHIKDMASSKKMSDGYVRVDEWASLKYNAALQFLGLAYDKQSGTDIFSDWAKGQMSYLMGNNNGSGGSGYCFVVGYNDKTVKNPHHRAVYDAANSFPNVNGQAKHLLLGALVGGPKETASGFADMASSYEYTEVGLDYNAPLVGAAAAHYWYVKNNGTDEEKAVQKTIDITKVSGIELRSLYKKGDINKDGNVDGKDASFIMRHILGETVLDISDADMNNDGEITITDAISLL